MQSGKYIIIEFPNKIESAVLFESLLNHNIVAESLCPSNSKVIAAGQFRVRGEVSHADDADIFIAVWGKCISLNIKSRGETDEYLIKKILRPKA